jgi:hypothetical protein
VTNELHWASQGAILQHDLKEYVRVEILGYDKPMGWASSVLAEGVFNFGIIVATVWMSLVGFVLRRISEWGYAGKSTMRYFVIAVLISYVFWFIRGDLIDLVRPVVWFGLVPYVAVFIVAKCLGALRTERRQTASTS